MKVDYPENFIDALRYSASIQDMNEIITFGENVMDYDFSGLCADQLEKIKKRLESLNKGFMKEYKLALNVINNPASNEHRGEIMVGVEDLMSDVVCKCDIFYTETMNKIQRELAKHL